MENITNLRETGLVVDELCLVYADTRKEVEAIRQVKETQAESLRLAEQKELSVKNIVREMTGNIQTLEDRVAHPPENKFIEEQQTISKTKASVQSEIDELEKRIQQQKSHLEQLSKTAEELLDEKVKEQQTTVREIPAIKRAIALYQNISGIEWDYDAKEPEIRGCFHLHNTKQVKPFEINPLKGDVKMTRADIVEIMWETLWEDQVQAAPSNGTKVSAKQLGFSN